MRHTAVFIACLLSVISAASAAMVITSGLIRYAGNGQVLTSNGDGAQTTLSDQGVCTNTQRWVYDSDGYIYRADNSSLVLDVKDSSINNGAQVIMWIKKVPGPGVDPRNQLWNVNSDNIQSRLTPNTFYIRKSSASSGVVNSNNSPYQVFQFVQPQYPCPATCQSHGDPHFTAWNGKRFDYQSAYSTVLLANWTSARVYTVQFPCNTGVTCNEGFVVHPSGTSQTLQITNFQVYFNRTAISLPLGTTNFSIYISVTKWSNTLYTIWLQGGYITYGVYSWYRGLYANIDVTITNGFPGPSICMGPADGQNTHTFGNQNLISAANQTAYVYATTPFSYNPNYVPNYGPYTTDDQALIANATRICSVLNSSNSPYATCRTFVDPTYYMGTCYNDSIAMGTVEFARSSIDEYLRACVEAAARNGTTITLPTSSVASIVINLTPTVNQNTLSWFTIISKDINFNNRTTGGDNWVVNATGPGTLTFTIVDNNNGTYTVWYTATVEGVYTIAVRLNGTDDASGSPFNVTVIAVTSATTTSFVFTVVRNTSLTITIQARTSSGAIRTVGGDTFTASFTGGDVTSITDNNDGTYTIIIFARIPGAQQLSVYLGTGSSAAQIACSPYTVNVM